MMHRRDFIKTTSLALGLAGGLAGCGTRAPSQIRASRSIPTVPYGTACGDVTATSAVLWARADRPARCRIELSTEASFRSVQRLFGQPALPENDFNSHAFLHHLIPGTTYYYRIQFECLSDSGNQSPVAQGQFKTAPDSRSTVRFCWSGDTVGQGFGIDADRGGLLTYASIRQRKPDFFVHCGDLIYADNPLPEERLLADGTTWKNLVTPAKVKVAETLDEFRGNFYYNLLDAQVRDLLAEVPVIQLWDDHEVVNNWYPGEVLEDDRYVIKDVDTLAARAKQAYFECNPVRPHPTHPQRIYRRIPYGPLLELFVIDLRSYRGPNTHNRQPVAGPDTAFLGEDQLQWLQSALKDSTATWKIICSDMPLGVVISEWGQEIYEAAANAENGPPLGRELEIAELLRFIARSAIENVHFITADVHYCASHYYNPASAAFKDFKPFWEFVSGPLHAGGFGPNALDGTFGPELKFLGIPEGMAPFSPPSDNHQFFGEMEIDPDTRALTVRHFNRIGECLWEHTLEDHTKPA
jgi:alkaline phosphatase D